MSLVFDFIGVDSLKFALGLEGDFELGLLYSVGTVLTLGMLEGRVNALCIMTQHEPFKDGAEYYSLDIKFLLQTHALNI